MMLNLNTNDCSGNHVTEYGKELINIIPDNKSQRILDIGCGTGKLTQMIGEKCGYVMGIDNSLEMINAARTFYPDIDFKLFDALDISFSQEWDIVFSNAVFHWIDDHNLLLKKINRSLKKTGVLICEFGAAGNNSEFEKSLKAAMERRGKPFKGNFNFTTEDEFGNLLIDNGFAIDCIYTYNKKTALPNGERGLLDWMINIYGNVLSEFSLAERKEILNEISEDLRPHLWNGSEWMADYKRISVVAYTV